MNARRELRCVHAPPVCQRKAMNDLLYSPTNLKSYTGPHGRVIVIGFMRSAGIFLSRLMEASTGPFNDIIIVSLPFPDTISRAGGAADVARLGRDRDDLSMEEHLAVYALYASLFVPVLCEEEEEKAAGAGEASPPPPPPAPAELPAPPAS